MSSSDDDDDFYDAKGTREFTQEDLMRKLESTYPNARRFLKLLDEMPLPSSTVNPLSYLVTANVIRKAAWSHAKIENLLPEFRALQAAIRDADAYEDGFRDINEAFQRFKAAAAEAEFTPEKVQTLEEEFNNLKIRTAASDQPVLDFLNRNVVDWEK